MQLLLAWPFRAVSPTIRWLAAIAVVVATLVVGPSVGRSDAARASYVVALTGSDSNPGTASAPWRTLRTALTRLKPGDTLTVRGGTYRERIGGTSGGFVNLRPATAAAPTRVMAASGERPIVKGLLWVDGLDHWTFDGINVTWDAERNVHTEHMVRLRNGIGWTFQNAEVWGARSFANVNVLSSKPGQPSGWTLRGNCIHDNVGDPTHGTAKDQLLYINTGTTAGPGLIERNLVFGAPRGKGIKLAGPDPGTGSTDVVVRWNTIVDTYKPPVNVAYATQRSTIYGNLIGETQEPQNGLIRGYELTGHGNAARNNYGWGAGRVVTNDAAYAGQVADADNVLAAAPGFDNRTCTGFHPLATAARPYGRYAPTTS